MTCPICEFKIWFYHPGCDGGRRRGILMYNSDLCDICYYRILRIIERKAPLKAGNPV